MAPIKRGKINFKWIDISLGLNRMVFEDYI